MIERVNGAPAILKYPGLMVVNILSTWPSRSKSCGSIISKEGPFQYKLRQLSPHLWMPRAWRTSRDSNVVRMGAYTQLIALMRLKKFIFWLLLLLITLGAIEVILSVYFFQSRSEHPLALVHAFHSARNKIYSNLPRSIGIWTRDAQFGYVHIPNTVGKHRKQDYTVTYTIGSDRERFIPTPENARGRILFLGGSFTFGQGVNDDQHFPYILSTHWTAWQIVNKAVMGWGTAHAYMIMAEEMESASPPAMVIYVMIPHHLERNYIRRSWLSALAKYDRDHPHFELVDGQLAFQGVVNEANSLEDSLEIRRQEIKLTNAFLSQIQSMCKTRQVPFLVVMLEDDFPYAINRTLVEKDIPVLDLSELELEAFPHDGHPNATDHQRIAEAILDSFVPDMVDDL